jgi:hypothetical protein
MPYSVGISMTGEAPNAAREIAAATTLATRMGGKARTPKPPTTFSREKKTPAIGALNAAEIPAAEPQATSRRKRSGLDRKKRPIFDPSADPTTATGPSAPTEPPVPIASAEAAVLTSTGPEGTVPPRLATARITSGMFSPSESSVPRTTISRVRARPVTETRTIARLPNPVTRATAESEPACARSIIL